MKMLRPDGFYAEEICIGGCRKNSYWNFRGHRIKKGDKLKYNRIILNVIDVTPGGIAIDYQQSFDGDS